MPHIVAHTGPASNGTIIASPLRGFFFATLSKPYGVPQMVRNVFSFLSFFVLTWLFLVHQAFAQASPVKRVFIVHSYEKGHICGQPQHDGAIAALDKAGWVLGKNLQVQAYYMDTKRRNNTRELIIEQAELAEKEIEQFNPDVVLTVDDNAFRTIALKADSEQSFVFSGMNGQPEDYNQVRRFMADRARPGRNITGVYEKLHVREAIHVLSTMHEMEQILVLDDLSPTGRAIARQVSLEIETSESRKPLPCEVKRQTIHSWEEFQETIDMINADDRIGALYLGTLLLKDIHGKAYTAKEIIDYTIAYSRKPAIGLSYAFIKQGLYGGATVDFHAMGRLAGEKIAKVLNGHKAGELPIEDAPRLALVFNLKRAETLGMHIPPDILMAADEVFRK